MRFAGKAMGENRKFREGRETKVVLRIHDVECCYGAHQALQGINLNIPRGIFLGIIGPNAAGKSTLLKTLAATLKPVRGIVLFYGQELEKISRRTLAQQVSVVPQETAMNFPFSVFDVVLMGRHPHMGRFSLESERDLAVIEAAMKATKCWHLRDRSILELSGGERQRVILGRALAQEPDVLLLDEPTAHLDLTFQLEMLEVLKELQLRRGLTVVAVFHDLNLAAQFSDQLLFLHKGKIFAVGNPNDVLTSEMIKNVYRTDVLIIKHPLTGVPQVVLLPGFNEEDQAFSQLRVHLICGGGIGAPLMGQLARRGCQVSAGVLNIGDTDWETARVLGLPVAEEKPFSSIDSQAYDTNLKLALEADAVFLLEIPFGHGNLPNVRILEPLLAAGKRCFLVEPVCLPERDYTGGEAMRVVSSLKERGLALLPDQQAVLEVVQILRKEKNGAATEVGKRPYSSLYWKQ